jgi:hypothetical protein
MTDADQVAVGSGAEHESEHRAAFDWTSTSPSTGVVEAVASATNRDPLALPQLYDAVDADALDSLVRASGGGVVVSFAFAGCQVTARSGGVVTVRPTDADADREP